MGTGTARPVSFPHPRQVLWATGPGPPGKMPTCVQITFLAPGQARVLDGQRYRKSTEVPGPGSQARQSASHSRKLASKASSTLWLCPA